MRIGTCLAVLLFGWSGSALAADPTECNGALVRPAMNFTAEAVDLDNAAYALKTRWNEEWRDIPPEIRLKRREAAIDEIYRAFADKRKAVYASATCLIVHTKTCASTPGNKHSCPMEVPAPPDTYYIKSTLQAIDDDFDVWPHIQGDFVYYTNKKTGRGSNTDGFRAQVGFKPGVIDNFVQQDLTRAQTYLTPLLRSVFVEPPMQPAPQCASLATELAKLAELRRTNLLTEEEYSAAKAAITRRCVS